MATHLPLDELSLVMGRIQGLLLTEEKVGEGISLLARAAASSIPGSTGAGVSLMDREGRRLSSGSTDAIVETVDHLQYDLDQGPCLTAWASGKTILSEDLAADLRWPSLAGAVASLPVHAVVSTPLTTRGHALGALKVYAAEAGAFDGETKQLLELFAGPAAILLDHVQTDETPRRLSETLMESLASRDEVSRACGALMERHGIDNEAAMRMLLEDAARQRITIRQAALSVMDGAADPSGR